MKLLRVLLPLALIVLALILALDQWTIYSQQRNTGALIGIIVAVFALLCGIAGFILTFRSVKKT